MAHCQSRFQSINRGMQMNKSFKWLGGLITNPTTGKISHSKLWANVAAAAATYKFVLLPDLDADIWIAYLGLVGGYAVARKWLSTRTNPNSRWEKSENE